MGITDRKITAWTNPIVAEATQPERSAEEMKGIFDSNSNQLKAALNGLLGDLAAPTAASQIGSEAIGGLEGTNVHAQIAALMSAKIASTGIKNLRISEDGYLEYTLDGTAWVKAPTWGEVTIDPNGNAKNLTVTFAQADGLTNIASDESMGVMFGKLKKWYEEIVAMSEDVMEQKQDIIAVDVRAGKLEATDKTFPAVKEASNQFTFTDESITTYTGVEIRRTLYFADASDLPAVRSTDGFTPLDYLPIYEYDTKPLKIRGGGQVVEVVKFAGGTCFFGVSAGGGDPVEIPSAPTAGDYFAIVDINTESTHVGGGNSATIRTLTPLKQAGIYKLRWSDKGVIGPGNAQIYVRVNGANQGAFYSVSSGETFRTLELSIPSNGVISFFGQGSSSGSCWVILTQVSAAWDSLEQYVAAKKAERLATLI